MMALMVPTYSSNMISADIHGAAFVRAALLLAVLWLAPLSLLGQDSGGGDMTVNSPPYAQYVGLPAQKINIEIQACPWCTIETTNLAHDLISLEKGEPFSLERYALTLEELELSKRFEEILTAVQPEEGGVAMSFYLTPAWVVRDIRVSGHAPLFKTDVLKAMSISPGDALLPDAFKAQAGLIADLYRREGFVDPQVSLYAEKDAGNGSAVLVVRVKPGRYYTLHRLTVHGNTAVTTAEIKSRMRSWRSSFFIRADGRYRSDEIRQDIKDLTSLYRQRGYAECRIDLKTQPDPQKATVEAEIAIVEGPHYEVRISGNERFWSSTLKKDLVLFKDGNLNRQGIRRSITNIKNRYRLAGYQFTTVDALEEKITLQGRVTRKLTFAVNEGPCAKKIGLRFTGNTAYPEKALRDLMQTGRGGLFKDDVFVPEILEEDLVNLRAQYLKEGYTDVQVDHTLEWSADQSSVVVTVAIVEGVRTMVSDIRFEGLSVIEGRNAEDALQLKKGQAFQEALLKQDEIALSHMIAAQGYPYVEIKARTLFNAEKTGVLIVFTVTQGKRVTMGRIYYQGNFATRKRPLAREILVNPGEAFSPQAMLKEQKNIRDMALFESVQFRTLGLKSKSDKVTLLVDMQETPPYYVQSGAGYTSDSGLFANARLGDRNLLGWGDDLWVGGEASQTGRNAQINLTQRRIFGTPATSTYALSYDRSEPFNQTFGTRIWTSSVNVLRELEKQHLRISLGLRYENRDEFVIEPTPQDEDTYDPRGIMVLSPSITYDTRDSIVRPHKGLIANVTTDVSKGLQNSLDNFLKYYLTLRTYWSPHQRLTLAWLARWNYIQTFGKESAIPQDQLFYSGGTMSVRGFEENMLRYDANKDPLGGRLTMVGSMEARFEATRNWEISLFYDTGAVRQTLSAGGSDDFRSSVGLGMRYITPIGPIGLLYGHKLRPKEGESNGRFHFSFGYTF